MPTPNTMPASDQLINDPALAETMAYAEKPHRDAIVERNRDKALVDAAAEEATEAWLQDSETMSTSQVIDLKQATETQKWQTLDDNLDSQAAADKAGERARIEHQGGSITEFGQGGEVVYKTER